MKINLTFAKELYLKLGTRNSLLILGALVAILVASLWQVGAAAPEMATSEVTRGEFIIDIEEAGELRALRSRSVSVPRNVRSSLQIIELAEEGTYVSKGDFLVQFDTSSVKQKVEEAQNDLTNAQADLESQKATQSSNLAQMDNDLKSQTYSYEQAKLKLQQMQFEAEAKAKESEYSVKKAKLNLDQAVEKIKAQKIIDAANLRKLELKAEQARLKLKQAREELNNLTLLAPQDGLVVYKEIWGGNGQEKVKVGDSPWRGQEVIGIPDLSTMLVKTQVEETEISKMRLGQEVIITLDAVPDPTFYGTITNIATLAQRRNNSSVKTFDIEVTIDGSNPVLKPGMTANCRIITDRIADAIYVPIEAVFEEDGKTVVYKRGSYKKPTAVEVGDKNFNFIMILSGITESDVVLLRNPTIPLEELGKEAPRENKPKTRPRRGNSSRMIMIG